MVNLIYIDDVKGIIVTFVSDAKILMQVGSALSFAKAARRLSMFPATLSRRVSDMERCAGVRFFDRTTRSVSVTSAGQLAFGHATRIVDEADALSVSLEAMTDAPTGRLRVSVPIILGQAAFGAVNSSFLSEYPDCDLFLDLTNRKVDIVEDGYDIAIRLGDPGDVDLIARRLGTLESGLYRSPNHEAPKDINDLNGMAFGLLRSRDNQGNEITLQDSAGNPSTVAVVPSLTTSNPELLIRAAVDLELTVVLPRIVTNDPVRKGQLVPLFPDHAVQRLDVFAVLPSRRLMRPAVRAF